MESNLFKRVDDIYAKEESKAGLTSALPVQFNLGGCRNEQVKLLQC